MKTSSYFAPHIKDNDTYYLMDDVSCLGNETSIRDCDFNGWGVHNCMPQEVLLFLSLFYVEFLPY